MNSKRLILTLVIFQALSFLLAAFIIGWRGASVTDGNPIETAIIAALMTPFLLMGVSSAIVGGAMYIILALFTRSSEQAEEEVNV